MTDLTYLIFITSCSNAFMTTSLLKYIYIYICLKIVKMWFLDLVGALVFVLVDGVRNEVVSITSGTKYLFLEIVVKSGKRISLSLKDFKDDENDFCRRFGKTESRSKFLQTWKQIDSKTISNDDDARIDGERLGSSLYDAKENMDQSQKQSMIGLNDERLKDGYLGIHNVHITNLVAPEEDLLVREIDYQHVKDLETSFKDAAFSQLVILSGMISGRPSDKLSEKNTQQKVAVLGGNHTRLALQSLLEKGLIAMECIKVNLYKPLEKSLALAVAFQHNAVLEEKKKSMSFLDKVKVMRGCRPAEVMTNKQKSQWKDMLCVVFRAETRRILTVRYHCALTLAGLRDELFTRLNVANDRMAVTERHMKRMLRLGNDFFKDCLDSWIEGGSGAFGAKISQLNKSSQGDSLENGNAITEDTEEEMQEEEFDLGNIETSDIIIDETSGGTEGLSYADLLLKINELESENASLREAQEGRRKRSLSEESETMIEEGATVMAKWTDGTFYAAKVAKIQKHETVYHVVFNDDGIKKKVKYEDLHLGV